MENVFSFQNCGRKYAWLYNTISALAYFIVASAAVVITVFIYRSIWGI